jgi:hypothetical protein
MTTTTPTEADNIELVEALADLRERHGLSVSYSTIWGAVAAGTVPAKRVCGKWYVARGDLAQIAAALAGGRRAVSLVKRSERPPAAA